MNEDPKNVGGIHEKNFFYSRVSSKDQSIERRISVAKEIGIDEEYLFIEKASGKDFKRPEYQLMKRMFRNGAFYILSPWIGWDEISK